MTGVAEQISSLRELITMVPNLTVSVRTLANQGFDIATRCNTGLEALMRGGDLPPPFLIRSRVQAAV